MDRFSFALVSASFPSLALAPRGRFARARLAYDGASVLGPVVVRWVPVSVWCGPVGRALNAWAFRHVS